MRLSKATQLFWEGFALAAMMQHAGTGLIKFDGSLLGNPDFERDSLMPVLGAVGGFAYAFVRNLNDADRGPGYVEQILSAPAILGAVTATCVIEALYNSHTFPKSDPRLERAVVANFVFKSSLLLGLVSTGLAIAAEMAFDHARGAHRDQHPHID